MALSATAKKLGIVAAITVVFAVIMIFFLVKHMKVNYVGESCPEGTSIDYTGGVSNVTGCFCPINKEWSTDNKCVSCPTGSTTLGTGEVAKGSFGACKCANEFESWSNANNACVACPTGSNTNKTGLPAGYFNYGSCRCGQNETFSTAEGKCITCPDVSTVVGKGLPTIGNCNCKNTAQYWNTYTKTCKTCPTGSSVVSSGYSTRVGPCNCSVNQGFNKSQNKCTNCPANSSTAFRAGQELGTVRGCYCIANKTLNASGTACV